MLPDVDPAADPASPCFILVAATGGSGAFGGILSALRPPFPPVLMIQAMHPAFVGRFAEQLRQAGPIDLKVVEDGDLVLPDRVLLATANWYPRFDGPPPRVRVTPDGDAPDLLRRGRPFDLALESAARAFGRNAVGVLLTALSRDGVDGCKAIRAEGGIALGQDAATSVLYGPSRIAREEGALDAQFPLDELPRIIRDFPAYRDALERNHPALFS
jgi:two-component system chemotaxis response regulator CheB